MPDLDKAYTWVIQTCNAKNVGYSQAYRNQKVVKGITYYDCSSMMNYALIAGGWKTPKYAPENNAFTTSVMPVVLPQLGFTEVDASGEYKAGDIGWTQGHTEMCYQGGYGSGVFMGAHTSKTTLPDQVSISNSPRSFTRLYRYGESDVKPYGYSAAVVAALAGNAWVESHVNPTVHQQGGNAFGLWQWDFFKDRMLEWMAENGYDEGDPYGQMTYLVVEDQWTPVGEFNTLTDFLTDTSHDAGWLAVIFEEGWERAGSPNLAERIRFAELAYDYILENANNPLINTWEIYPEYYLTEQQALNNAVLMYRFYSAGGGGGGDNSKIHRRTLPIWMMIRYHI